MSADAFPLSPPEHGNASRIRSALSSGTVDFIGQQVVWWSAVGLVHTERSALAALPALAWIALFTWTHGRDALSMAGLGVLVGVCVDGSLIHFGAMDLRAPMDLGVTSSWMLGLWAVFAMAFLASMRWLVGRSPALAACIGGVAGVIAYRAGHKLGVLRVTEGVIPLLAIGAAWACALATLQLAARRIRARREAKQ